MGFINGEPFCLFTGLNGNSLAKGSSFPNVYYIIYEEVMPEPGEKIIKDEYKKLESIIVTVDRFEDRIEVICVGNNTSYYNPISPFNSYSTLGNSFCNTSVKYVVAMLSAWFLYLLNINA